MKTTFVFLAFLFCSIFIAEQANSQAIVEKDGVHYLIADGEMVPAITFQKVTTPSGNVTWRMTFQLSLWNPYLPEKGVAKYSFSTGADGGYTDVETLFFANGKVILLYHRNGSGNVTPNK